MTRHTVPLYWGVHLLLFYATLCAQQPTGSITGIVADPSGGVVPEAAVTVTNRATQGTLRLNTTTAGAYTAFSLPPGEYEVRVEAEGFKTAVQGLTVEVGRVTTADVRLVLGSKTEIVNVTEQAVAVNPVQTSIEGVVTSDLIRNLPLNGRNFLDLGQMEPGVQVHGQLNKGQAFVGLSTGGATGRTTRITLDGFDVSDETLGTSSLNISQDSIQEFQISRNSPDVSTDLTDTGAVNIVTKGGSNRVHGDAFFFMRDDAFAARVGQESYPFDREQIGFNLGGPFVRDKLFWFVNYERNNQDSVVATNLPAFPQFNNTWPIPFDERMVTMRADWTVSSGVRAFFRFNHNWLNAVGYVGGENLMPDAGQVITNQSAVGIDLSMGRFVHSFRYGYLDSNLHMKDARAQIPGIPWTLDPAGRDITFQFYGEGGLIGPYWVLPQHGLQDNHQFRYDASLAFGRHLLRWGGNTNIVRSNGFVASAYPVVSVLVTESTRQGVAAAGLDPYDPLNYPVIAAQIPNGLGWQSEVPTMGYPFGGFKNNRVHWYLADTWRRSPRLTLNYGLRYVYEPGQNNHDLARPALLDEFIPGLSQRTRRDRNNFAPNLGVAWDPTGSRKWLVRAGSGIFYATNIFLNTIDERQNFIPPGIAGQFFYPPFQPVLDPRTSNIIWDGTCCGGQSISFLPANTPGLLDAVFTATDALKSASLAATADFPSGPTVFEQTLGTVSLYDPGYSTPYSFHFNAGLQRELRPGLVLSVDFLYQRGVHSILKRNFNRTGAADTLSVPNALAVMDSVHGMLGCPPGPSGVDCAIAAGARISDYGAFGLGGCEWATSGSPNSCAFPGENPGFNKMVIVGMQGKSSYKALQAQLRGTMPNLGRAVTGWEMVASYSLSRYRSTSWDTSFISDLWNNDEILKSYGPHAPERTHMLSVANLFTIPSGIRLSSIWRVNSALPNSVYVSMVSGGPEEIFLTDFDGDGSTWDQLPGTGIGSFGRRIGNPADLNRLISGFNKNVVGTFTPAGQAVIDAGLFSSSQFVALGATANGGNPVPLAPAGQVMLDSFITTDLRISRPFKLWGERITLEPGIEVFNLFNVANYDLPGLTLSGELTGTPGSINGTTAANRPNRAEFGAGSFAPGIPRAWQVAVRVTF